MTKVSIASALNTPRTALVITLTILVAVTYYLSLFPEEVRRPIYDRAGVVAYTPPYYDMNYILASLDCARTGIPPTDTCPAAGYSFIYPKTFYLLIPTGLSARHTLPMVLIVQLGFILAMAAFLGSLSWKQCGYACILLASPPAILALERCNIDLAIISILAMAVLCLEAGRRPGLALLGITAATLMKIYPFVAIASAFGRVRRSHILVATIACVVGLGLQLDHLRFIASTVPRISQYSWGYSVAFMTIRSRLEIRGLEWLLPAGIEHVLQFGSPLVCLAIAFRITRRHKVPVLAEMKNSVGLIAGSSIYVFCWLSGPNFDYRYLMLILTLPFLCSSQADPKRAEPIRRLSRIALLCMAPTFWLSLSYQRPVLTVVQEALGLVLFCSFTTALLIIAIQSVEKARATPTAASV